MNRVEDQLAKLLPFSIDTCRQQLLMDSSIVQSAARLFDRAWVSAFAQPLGYSLNGVDLSR